MKKQPAKKAPPAEIPEQFKAVLENAKPKQVEVTVPIGDVELKFQVTTSLPLAARTKMAIDISDMIFVDEIYLSSMEKFARLSTLLVYYTNIDTNVFTVDQLDVICQQADLFKAIYEVVTDDISEVFDAANRLIEWKKQRILRAKSDELYDAAKDLVNSLERFLSQFEGTDLGKVQELTDLARAVASKSERELGHGIIEFREAQKATAPKSRSVRKKAAATGEKAVPTKE